MQNSKESISSFQEQEHSINDTSDIHEKPSPSPDDMIQTSREISENSFKSPVNSVNRSIKSNDDEEKQGESTQDKHDSQKRRSGLRSRKIRIVIVVLLLTVMLVVVILALVTQTSVLSYKAENNSTTSGKVSTQSITSQSPQEISMNLTRPYELVSDSSNSSPISINSSMAANDSNINTTSPVEQTLDRYYDTLFTNNATHRSTNTTTKSQLPNNLILISLDGFSPQYLSFHSISTIKYLGDNGAIANGMIPIFPTVTFPNHYSIVTGTMPAYHGIVGQTFYDSKLKDWFNYKNNSRNDPKWWLVDPIWNTVQDSGLKSACCFWPGTEAYIMNRKPNYNIPYDESLSNVDRMSQVLKWLDLPENGGQHPSFYCTYMSIVDKIGQKTGPTDNDSLLDAIEDVNSAIQFLVDGLITRNLTQKTNIIIVSDHGMSSVYPEYGIVDLNTLNPKLIDSIDISGAVAFIRPKSGFEAIVFSQLTYASHGRFSVHVKGKFPSEFNLDSLNNDVDSRIAPFIALCNPGFMFASLKNNSLDEKGAHGYSPQFEDMNALFVAIGPDIRPKIKLDKFSILDVYNLMCSMLSINAQPNNGSTYLVDELLNR